MVQSIKSIVRNQRGFSISELLVTSAILLLVSAIMAAGVPAALRSYMRVVDASNAQLLLATTSTRLRDELGVADVNTGSGPTTSTDGVTFVSMETGFTTTVKKNSDKGITLVEAASSEDSSVETDLVPQASGKGAKTNLRTTFDSIEYSNGVFTVKNLRVLDGNDSEIAGAKFDTLKIRALEAPQS